MASGRTLVDLVFLVPRWMIGLALLIFAVIVGYATFASDEVIKLGVLGDFGRVGVATPTEIPGITVRTFRHSFYGIAQPAQIPGSANADFCALARVDDDSPKGSCLVTKDDSGNWIMESGGDGGDNSCAAQCMFIEIAKP